MAKTVNMLYERHNDGKICSSHAKLACIFIRMLKTDGCLCSMSKQTTPFGSQKIFFDRIWRHLHPELSLEKEAANSTLKKATRTKPPSAQHLKKLSGQTQPTQVVDSQNTTRHHAFQTYDSNNAFVPEAGTPLSHCHISSTRAN